MVWAQVPRTCAHIQNSAQTGGRNCAGYPDQVVIDAFGQGLCEELESFRGAEALLLYLVVFARLSSRDVAEATSSQRASRWAARHAL